MTQKNSTCRFFARRVPQITTGSILEDIIKYTEERDRLIQIERDKKIKKPVIKKSCSDMNKVVLSSRVDAKVRRIAKFMTRTS
jgi:hypothetical protein